MFRFRVRGGAHFCLEPRRVLIRELKAPRGELKEAAVCDNKSAAAIPESEVIVPVIAFIFIYVRGRWAVANVMVPTRKHHLYPTVDFPEHLFHMHTLSLPKEIIAWQLINHIATAAHELRLQSVDMLDCSLQHLFLGGPSRLLQKACNKYWSAGGCGLIAGILTKLRIRDEDEEVISRPFPLVFTRQPLKFTVFGQHEAIRIHQLLAELDFLLAERVQPVTWILELRKTRSIDEKVQSSYRSRKCWTRRDDMAASGCQQISQQLMEPWSG
jgi:hypothetical protein